MFNSICSGVARQFASRVVSNVAARRITTTSLPTAAYRQPSWYTSKATPAPTSAAQRLYTQNLTQSLTNGTSKFHVKPFAGLNRAFKQFGITAVAPSHRKYVTTVPVLFGAWGFSATQDGQTNQSGAASETAVTSSNKTPTESDDMDKNQDEQGDEEGDDDEDVAIDFDNIPFTPFDYGTFKYHQYLRDFKEPTTQDEKAFHELVSTIAQDLEVMSDYVDHLNDNMSRFTPQIERQVVFFSVSFREVRGFAENPKTEFYSRLLNETARAIETVQQTQGYVRESLGRIAENLQEAAKVDVNALNDEERNQLFSNLKELYDHTHGRVRFFLDFYADLYRDINHQLSPALDGFFMNLSDRYGKAFERAYEEIEAQTDRYDFDDNRGYNFRDEYDDYDIDEEDQNEYEQEYEEERRPPPRRRGRRD